MSEESAALESLNVISRYAERIAVALERIAEAQEKQARVSESFVGSSPMSIEEVISAEDEPEPKVKEVIMPKWRIESTFDSNRVTETRAVEIFESIYAPPREIAIHGAQLLERDATERMIDGARMVVHVTSPSGTITSWEVFGAMVPKFYAEERETRNV